MRNINIDAALAEARERFVERNPKSRALHEEACSSMPGGNTRTVLFYAPYPLVLLVFFSRRDVRTAMTA